MHRNFRGSAIVEYPHKYGAIFWDEWLVKSLGSALKEPNYQRFNTITKAEMKYLFMQQQKFTRFCHLILQVFSSLLANETKFSIDRF